LGKYKILVESARFQDLIGNGHFDWEIETPYKLLFFNSEFSFTAYFFPDGKHMLGNSWKIERHKGYLSYEQTGYVYGFYSLVFLLPRLRLGT
jgi:hypothetical protein